MRSPIVALALLAATVSARQAPFGKPAALATSSLQRSSKSALDVASPTLSVDVTNRDIAVRGGDDDSSLSLLARLKIGGYFALWYILNVVYNSEYI